MSANIPHIMSAKLLGTRKGSVLARPRKFDEEHALLLAMDVFWEKGFVETSVQDLCAAMNINSGSLYASFGAKQDVFLAAIRQYIETVTAEGVALVANAPSGVQGIAAYFDYIIGGISSGNRRYGCLGTNSFLELRSTENEAVHIVARHFKLLESAFLDALKRDAISRAETQAQYLVCLAQGLNVLALTQPTRDQLEQIVDIALMQFEPTKAVA